MAKDNKTLKFAAVALIVFIISATALVLLELRDGGAPVDTAAVRLYFLNPLNNEIEYEYRNIPNGEQLIMLQDTLAEFIIGPNSETLARTYPEGLGIDVVLVSPVSDSENNKTVEIIFPAEYNNLPLLDEIVLRASLVYTLTDLNFVKNVEILVSDPENPSLKKVLLRSNSQPLGRASRENLHISPYITSDKFTRKYVTLYFPNKEQTGLGAESRLIDVPSDSFEEKVMVEQIIKGPVSEGLVNLWPADLRIIDIRIDNKVCYIDLGGPVELGNPEVQNSIRLLTYAVVNTLTMPDVNVKRVQFLNNGEKLSPESQPLEKDESLILDKGQED